MDRQTQRRGSAMALNSRAKGLQHGTVANLRIMGWQGVEAMS